MFLIPLAFVLVMLGGMGLSTTDGYDAVSFVLIVVGFAGAIGTAGLGTQS